MEPIIRETLDTLLEYIPRLQEVSGTITRTLQSSEPALGLQQLPQVFEGIEWVIAAIQGLKKNGFLLEIEIVQANDYFIEMENAIKKNDYVLLADLLEYEILPILEEWLDDILPLRN